MKNKLFFSLSLLVAANVFVATPASALTWEKAAKVTGKAALATGKTVFGLAALGAAAFLPAVFIADQCSGRAIKSLKINGNFNCVAIGEYTNFHRPMCVADINQSFNNVDILPAIYVMMGATSMFSAVLGGLSLKSAWNDIKTINK